MSRAIRQHLRSNVVGYIALFCFAMGGTAYATHPGGANTAASAPATSRTGQVQNADDWDRVAQRLGHATPTAGSRTRST